MGRNEAEVRYTICDPSFNHDDKDDDDIIVEGSAGEFKTQYLVIGLNLLQVWKSSCRACLQSSRWRTSKIVIYGLLVDITTGNTTVGKLIMNFLEAQSTITWSRDSIHLNECLWRLRQVLSE